MQRDTSKYKEEIANDIAFKKTKELEEANIKIKEQSSKIIVLEN